jgi:16S rRNA (uracil1498-N3)-methyltransferase
MQLFYDNLITKKGIYNLNDEETSHAVKVLRLKSGEEIDITNGMGYFFKAKIQSITKNNCTIEVFEEKFFEKERNYNLHIAIAPTKNIERFEWFVEKAVEIGIDRITPIISRYSERKVLKTERVEKIIISAMKQSLKAYKPQLDELMTFKDFIKNANAENKIIAECNTENTLKNFELKSTNIFMIGPEGGFDNNEFELSYKQGFKPLKINEFRLRTETAGVMTAATLSVLSQKF